MSGEVAWRGYLGELEKALAAIKAGSWPDVPRAPEHCQLPDALREQARAILADLYAIEAGLRARKRDIARRLEQIDKLSQRALYMRI